MQGFLGFEARANVARFSRRFRLVTMDTTLDQDGMQRSRGAEVGLRDLPYCPLDRHLYTSDPAALGVIEWLSGAIDDAMSAVRAEKSLGRSRPSRASAHAARVRFLGCVIVNFFDNWIVDPARRVGIRLGKEDYRGTEFTYRAVKHVMAGLERLKLVENEGSEWNPIEEFGTVSRFKATPRLIEMMAGWPLSIVQVRERNPLVEIRPNGKHRRGVAKRLARAAARRAIRRAKLAEVGKTLAPRKRRERPRKTIGWPRDQRRNRRRIEKNIRTLNEALRTQFQGLAIPDDKLRTALGGNARPVNLRRQQVHRAFIDDPQHGGRYAGPFWMLIRRELRQHIRMAAPGEEPQATIELDFDTLHPAMLMAMRKHPIEGDLYAIYESPVLNKRLREPIKALLLTSINADSDVEAINSFKEQINTENYPEWVAREFDMDLAALQREARKAPYEDCSAKLAEMYPGCPPPEQLLKDIKRKHWQIADSFCTGAGRELMFFDSEISEQILNTVLRESGIVPLIVHDSYVVPAKHEALLKQTMETMFAARFAGITPLISKKVPTQSPYPLSDDDLYSRLLAQWRASQKKVRTN